jgi:hypothetical protein
MERLAVIPVNPGDCFCESAEEGAALGLLGLMTGLSEEYFCAGWIKDLEYWLWRAVSNQSFGMGKISERQAELLRLLSEECDGWWIWEADNPKFVSLEWWRAHLLARG